MSQVYDTAGLKKTPAAGGGAITNINVSAGTTSNNLSAVTFSDGSGVLWGLNGSVITASVATNYLTTAMASNAATISNINVSGGTTSNLLSKITFADSNGVSWGLNASTLTASVQTNYLTTAMLSNAATISNINVSAGTTSNLLSKVTFSDSNGISFGLNASTITASHNAITTGALSNHSHGVSFTSGSVGFQTLSFTNSNGISFNSGTQGIFGSHNAITTGRASTDAIGLNTAQTNVTWTVNSSGLSLNAGGYAGTVTGATNCSVTANTAGVSVNVAAGGAVAASFTSGSVTFQTLSFTNSNGISFNSGTQGVFGSHNAITTGRASTDAIGLNTAQTNVTWTVNSSGLSLNAGGYAGTVSGATNCSVTVNTAGVSVNLPAYLTTAALSNHSHGVSFTSGSTVFQTLSFTNSNGISFNSGTQGIFGSHNAITTGRASTDAIGLNTAQTNVTWTVNSSGLSLNAGGYAGTVTAATNATFTLNSAGLSLSVGAGGGAGFSAGMSTLGNTAGNTGVTGTRLVFVGTNAVSLSQTTDANGGTLSINVATQTAQTQSNIAGVYDGANSISTGTIQFTNANGVTFSVNGQTLSASVVAPKTYSTYEPFPFLGWSTNTVTMNAAATGVVSLYPFYVKDYVSVGVVNFLINASAPAFGSAGCSATLSEYLYIYTRGTGANSTTLGTWTTRSFSYGISESGATSGGSGISITVNQPTTTAFSGYGTATTSFSSSGTAVSSVWNLYTAGSTGTAKMLQFPLSTLITPGEYWFAPYQARSTAGNNRGFYIAGHFGGGVFNFAQLNAPMGSNITAYSTGAKSEGGPWHIGLGILSTNTGFSVPPASIAFSNLINGGGSVLTVIPMMKFWST